MLGPREASPDVQDKEAEAAERPSQDPGFCQGQSSRGGGGVLVRHKPLVEEWGSVCVTTRHTCTCGGQTTLGEAALLPSEFQGWNLVLRRVASTFACWAL